MKGQTPRGATQVIPKRAIYSPKRKKKKERRAQEVRGEAVTFSRRNEIISTIIMTIISIPIFLSYLWLFLSSFSAKMWHGLIPLKFTLHNWRFLWQPIKFGAVMHTSIWPITLNTLLLALAVTISEVLVSTLSGYALSRFRFKGRVMIQGMTMLLHAFPGVALLIAIYYVLYTMRLLDTLWGVMLVKISLEIPMSTNIIKGFFDNIPWDIEWSSFVDGCNRWQTWRYVILPLLKPGIAAISLFSFLSGWGEFLYIYTFIFTSKKQTLATFLNSLIGEFKFVDYGLLSAVATFYMIPTLLFFIFTQKALLQMSFGGRKA